MSFERREQEPEPTSTSKAEPAPIDLSRRGFLLGQSGASLEGGTRDNAGDLHQSEIVSTTEPDRGVAPKMSRRDFLKTATVGAGAFAGAVVIAHPVARRTMDFLDDIGGGEGLKRLKKGMERGRLTQYIAERQKESLNKETLEQELDSLTREFRERYHILIVFEANLHHQRSDIASTSTEANLSSKLAAAHELLQTFRRYPDSLIQELHIPSITVRNNIKNSAGKLEGFAILSDHSITVDVNDDVWRALQIAKDTTRRILVSSIHHELFHLIDPFTHVEEDGTVSNRDERLERWHSLLASTSSVYLGNDWNRSDYSGDHPRGFARDYGRKDELEDRATVFELMMKGIWKNSLDPDPVLLVKIETINEEIFLRSRGAMRFSFVGDYGSYRYSLEDDESWMREIAETDRQTMASQESIFKNVSDEEYRSWQEFYRAKLAKKKPTT
ncbi:MAG: twin-arginine translocation signal domain-containing protein [Candidatus Moraniibacteriota bacterium]